MVMKDILRAGGIALALGLTAPLLVACEDEPAEEMGEAMEETGEDMEEAVD